MGLPTVVVVIRRGQGEGGMLRRVENMMALVAVQYVQGTRSGSSGVGGHRRGRGLLMLFIGLL